MMLQGVVFSEILGKHIELIMTKRGVRLVDEAAGFDSYLLSTAVNEVYATRLLRVKRELLLALAEPDRLSGSVYEKYQRFAVSREEADWHGLSMNEARRKQGAIEAEARKSETIPDKEKFRKELVEMLKSGRLEEEELGLMGEEEKGGLLGSMKNVFGRK